MTTLRIILIPLAGTALFGAAFCLWQQQQEIDALKVRASAAVTELTQRVVEPDELEKRLREVREEARALRGELTQTREEQKSMLQKAAAKKNESVPGDAGQVNAEMLKQWLTDANDTAVLRRLNLQARNKTLQRYSEFIEQLALTPEQADLLTKLLTDKRQAAMDVAVVSYQRGENPSNDMGAYHALIATTRDGIEQQINVLLGGTKYAQYQDFNRSVGQSNVLNNLELALRGTSASLNPDQIARFTAVLQESNATEITDKVINASRELLSPLQLQTLEDLHAVQQANSQQRNQPGQALPNAPPVPAPKTKN